MWPTSSKQTDFYVKKTSYNQKQGSTPCSYPRLNANSENPFFVLKVIIVFKVDVKAIQTPI